MEKQSGAKGKGRRLFVRAIAEIIDARTGQLVGAQYRWNTGERRLEWFGDVPPLDRETPGCDYAASGMVSIWSRRNWAGERCPCRSISQYSL